MRKHEGQKGSVQEKHDKMAGKSKLLMSSTPREQIYYWVQDLFRPRFNKYETQIKLKVILPLMAL